MGVYIPCMEMPKGGEMIVVFSDGAVQKCLLGVKEALETSEAVQLPPHGRLGDLDALSKTIKSHAEDWGFGYDYGESDLEYDLDSAPTIIQADEEKT